MAEPVNFTLEEGEHIAIIGRNGSGKSMFVDMITGRHPAFPDMVEYGFDEPYNNLKHITFRDTYGGDNDKTYFLQQRWNQMEIDEETPTVGSKLEEAFRLAGEDTAERRAFQQHIYELFHLKDLLDKYIILLSSGELRKYKLAASLFTKPRVLIMENPFIGLDAQTRDQLKELLAMLAKEQGLQIILVLAKTDEIPDFITHIVEVRDRRVLEKVAIEEFRDKSLKFRVESLEFRDDYSVAEEGLAHKSTINYKLMEKPQKAKKKKQAEDGMQNIQNVPAQTQKQNQQPQGMDLFGDIFGGPSTGANTNPQPQPAGGNDIFNLLGNMGGNNNQNTGAQPQGGLMDLNSILTGNNTNTNQQAPPQQQNNVAQNLNEVYKNGDITIYTSLFKNNNVYNGSFFVSNNTSSQINEVAINLLVKKYISCQIHSTSGKDLAPNASLGIRKDVTMTNNDPNKGVVIKMTINYVKDGNNVSDSKVVTL